MKRFAAWTTAVVLGTAGAGSGQEGDGAASSLKVHLIGEDGEPVEGAAVTVEGGPEGKPAADLGRGKYRLDDLSPGVHKVWARAPGRIASFEGVRIPRRDPLWLRLREARPIAGTVRSWDGRPIEGAEVEVYTHEEGKVFTDRSGRFAIDGDRGGTRFDVSADGYAVEKRVVNPGTEDLEVWMVPEAVVAGKVVSEKDGTPVAGAEVWIDLWERAEWQDPHDLVDPSFFAELRTDSRGAFEFRKVPPGKYWVAAGHGLPFTAASEPRAVGPGDRVEDVLIRLGPQGSPEAPESLQGSPTAPDRPPGAYRIHGRVLDPQGAAIEGAEVRLDYPSHGAPSTWTDEAGKYELRVHEQAPRTVRIAAPGRMSVTLEDVEAGEEGGVPTPDAILGGGEKLAGRVVDSAGRPIQKAVVRVEQDTGDTETRTDAEGRFQASGLRVGRVRLDAGKDGFSGQRATGEVPGEEVVFRLDRPATVFGQLRAEGQATFPMAKVGVYVIDGEGDRSLDFYHEFWTDFTGRFRLDLVAGKYALFPWFRGFAAGHRSIVLEAGQRVEGLVLDLRRGGAIAGAVVRWDGLPLQGVEVTVEGPETLAGRDLIRNFLPRMKTDDDGKFQLEHVPEGKVSLLAFHEEEGRVLVEGFPVEEGKIAGIRMAMPRPGVLQGAVTRNGKAWAGAEVRILDENGEDLTEDLLVPAGRRDGHLSFRLGSFSLPPPRTGPEGVLAFDHLLPGVYRLSARKGGARADLDRVAVAEGHAAEALLTFR